MIGETIDGKYRVVRILGQGGMGAVYEAEHTGTRRRVAVKVILNADLAKHESIVQRFQREAQAAGSIETDHIVQVLDSGMDVRASVPYMVMEFLRGEDLQSLVKRCGCLAPELALRIVGQACTGLLKAHEAGVIHRDIKPANIFLARRDNGEVLVKLVDFGIAKIAQDIAGPEDTGLTRTGNLLGSPRYMSPEQAMGVKTIDHRTDVWSMGVVLYEALTGRVPHAHCESLGAMIMAICSEQAPHIQDLAPWVTPDVAEIVHAALVIDRARRFQSVSALLAAIRHVVPGGFSIRDDMLIPLPDTQRTFIAPRTFSGATRLPVPGMTSDQGVHTGTDAATVGSSNALTGAASSTIAGVQAPAAGRSPRGSIIALVATAVLGVGAFLGYRALAARPAASAAADRAASAIAPPPELPPSATPSVTASVVAAPAIVERAFRLEIVAPSTAVVEIDDAVAQVENGSVELRGALGSKHRVRIRLGKTETVGDVVVADSGLVPAKVQLGAAVAPKPKASGKVSEPGVSRTFD